MIRLSPDGLIRRGIGLYCFYEYQFRGEDRGDVYGDAVVRYGSAVDFVFFTRVVEGNFILFAC